MSCGSPKQTSRTATRATSEIRYIPRGSSSLEVARDPRLAAPGGCRTLAEGRHAPLGKRRESLARRSEDAALAFTLSRTRLRVGWVWRPMPWLNLRPSLGGVSREPPEVEALSWFSEEERGECPFCGERAVVGPAGARICLACETPVHSAAEEEQ